MLAKRTSSSAASLWSACIALMLGVLLSLVLPAAGLAAGATPSPEAVSAAPASGSATPLFDLNDARHAEGAWFSSFMAPANALALTGDNRIDSLLSGAQLTFSGSGATSRTVTYSFYEDSVWGGYYKYASAEETRVREVSEGTKTNVRNIFAWYSTIMNVDFVEVTETSSTIGDYRVMISDAPSYAYCYYPYTNLTEYKSSDIHLRGSYDIVDGNNGFQNPPGSHGYSSLVHEIGHGMGLKHPFEDTPVLPVIDDNTANTVMTYSVTGNEPGTAMAYDIATLHYVYGARAKNTGNDTYAFTSRGTSQYTRGGTTYMSTPNQIKQTIWDSAGFDTLDAASLPNVGTGYKFDLRGNGWLIDTSAEATNGAGKHYFQNGSSLAFSFAPEKIVNSSSNDRIIANSSANTFAGYTVARSVGADRIEGASAADKLDLTAYLEGNVIKSRVGNDLLLNLGAPGSVTLVDYYAGNVPAIEYSGEAPNVAPTPLIFSSATSGVAPMSVTFDGSASSDSDGSIQSWAWNFSDGTSASGLTVSKFYWVAGTYTASLTVMDNDGASATTTTTITVAPALGSLVGTVTSGGLPLSGVTVSIAGRTASTNALGGYSLASIPATMCPVTFSKTGYASQTETVTITHNTTTTSSPTLIQEIGNLSGTVKYGATALGGVTVSVAGTTTTTAADGTYSVNAIPKGTYAATYSTNGYVSQTTSVTINTGVTTIKHIFLVRQTGTCSGTVTSGGVALSGVSVSLTSPSGNRSTTTNGSGVYTITGLLTGSYSATYARSRYDTQTMPAVISASQTTTVDVSLVRQTGTLSGTVTSGGVAIPGVTVSVSGLTTTTAADGTYSIGSIPTGSYPVSYAKSGYATQTAGVSILASQTTSSSVALVRETGTLSGIVSSGGTALAGVSVSVSVTGLTTTTDATGTYSITSIPTGVYSASYSKSGYTTQLATVTISASATTSSSVSLVLAPITERIVERVAGLNRFEVSANLARKGWDPKNDQSWTDVGDVIVANGETGKEGDPLSAAGLAGAFDCPVLLTTAASLPEATRVVLTQIASKNPGLKVHIIGGTASVPVARWNDIKKIPGVSGTIDRIDGANRYDVSANIANRIVAEKGAAAIQGVILIAADNPAAFYDALAASPIAYANTMPMLSVRKTSIAASVLTELNSAALADRPRYAASSSAYIGAAALAGAKVRLTTSSNRFTAASDIASYAIAEEWSDSADTGVAAKLPDALTGGTFLGKRGGVLLFTESTNAIQATSKTFITNHKSTIFNGWIFGGTGSVPAAQETSFNTLLK